MMQPTISQAKCTVPFDPFPKPVRFPVQSPNCVIILSAVGLEKQKSKSPQGVCVLMDDIKYVWFKIEKYQMLHHVITLI